MNRAAVLLATGAFWAFMMAALVKREILPIFEYQAPPSYRTMFRATQHPELEKRAIYFGAERRGEAESLLEPLANGCYRARTRLDLNMSVKGEELPVAMRYEVNIDPLYQLSDFQMNFVSMGQALRLSGVRRGDRLALAFDLGLLGRRTQEVDFPKDMTFSDGFLAYQGGAKLSVGKKWRVQTMDFDLKGLSSFKAFARVERRENHRWRGKEVPTYVVEIRKNENDELPWHTLWVNEDGTVLEQQMSAGNLLYRIVLEDKSTLTAAEAKEWR